MPGASPGCLGILGRRGSFRKLRVPQAKAGRTGQYGGACLLGGDPAGVRLAALSAALSLPAPDPEDNQPLTTLCLQLCLVTALDKGSLCQPSFSLQPSAEWECGESASRGHEDLERPDPSVGGGCEGGQCVDAASEAGGRALRLPGRTSC